MEVSIARFKRCQHRPQLWEEWLWAGGSCSMCFMCEACSGSTKEVVLTLALPGGETLGSAEFLHLKSRMCFSDWNVDVECILPKWWSRVSAVECILEPRRLDQESGHRTYCFRAMSKFTQLVVLELTMLLRFTKHNNCTFYLLSAACLKHTICNWSLPNLLRIKTTKRMMKATTKFVSREPPPPIVSYWPTSQKNMQKFYFWLLHRCSLKVSTHNLILKKNTRKICDGKPCTFHVSLGFCASPHGCCAL